MRRVSSYELTSDEADVLALCKAAAIAQTTAEQARYRACIAAADMGLPVRLIGLYANFSGAQVSRLSTAARRSA